MQTCSVVFTGKAEICAFLGFEVEDVGRAKAAVSVSALEELTCMSTV